jgi:ParB family transcriptional regulator, chromosome partitioning protein
MVKSKPERRGLGRGLSALMADVDLVTPEGNKDQPAAPRAPDTHLPIEKLSPNPDQPRRDFAEGDLEDLTASIRERGIIQPLLVRVNPTDPGSHQIVAGERRWRAAQRAGLHEVPVLIRELSDQEVIEVAIIENIQRADLNPVEEALGYRQLMDRFGHTQEKLSEVLGKSRSHIANLLRLLSLPEEILEYLREGKLSSGHARALITAENQLELAKSAIKKGLSVRQVEKLAKKAGFKKDSSSIIKAEKDADTKALELDLTANLKMKVRIDHQTGGETGALTVHYDSLDQLDELCRILTISPRAETE